MPGEQPAGEDELAADPLDVGIVAAIALTVAFLETQHPLTVAPDLRQRLGVDGQADDQRALQLGELVELLGLADDRHVGGLDPAMGEVDAGRRLGGARDADQDHVGTLEIVAAPGRRRAASRSRCAAMRRK